MARTREAEIVTAIVRERMRLLRAEHPDGNYPTPWADHTPGECIECDALRRLRYEADA